MEFKRAHLYDINPVGVGRHDDRDRWCRSPRLGVFGPTAKELSAFVGARGRVLAAPLDRLCDRRQILHRAQPKRSWQNIEQIQCCICEHHFEPRDTASCPAYAGPICSLSVRWMRVARISASHMRGRQAQVSEALGKFAASSRFTKKINSQLGHFSACSSVRRLVALTLGLI